MLHNKQLYIIFYIDKNHLYIIIIYLFS